MSASDLRPVVLIAEDAITTATILSAVLRGAGYEVLLAEDGEQCLSLCRSDHPDLVVLDLMLPKVHGLEVLEQLRRDESTADIGVLVCSAKDYKTEMEQVGELGAFDFLSKPVRKEVLLDAVQRYLASRAGSGARVISDAPAPEAPGETAYHPRVPADRSVVRFWGTRGSTPVSGPDFIRHGGNTSCMEVAHGDERVLFDAGSGIRDVGLDLMSDGPRHVHLFISHTHWDHIQGFPFFTPAYVPGFEITIHAPRNVEKDIESIFRGQLDRAYFPVQMEDMQARFSFHDLGDEAVEIGDVTVSWEYAMHPGAAVGYKVETGGHSLAYFTDNELMKGYRGPPSALVPGNELLEMHRDQIDFMTGVDVLIHEAQYTTEEYGDKVGWGHSSLANACALVAQTGVSRWIIPHHDPEHDDDTLQGKLTLTREILRELSCRVEVSHAYDGMTELV